MNVRILGTDVLEISHHGLPSMDRADFISGHDPDRT